MPIDPTIGLPGVHLFLLATTGEKSVPLQALHQFVIERLVHPFSIIMTLLPASRKAFVTAMGRSMCSDSSPFMTLRRLLRTASKSRVLQSIGKSMPVYVIALWR